MDEERRVELRALSISRLFHLSLLTHTHTHTHTHVALSFPRYFEPEFNVTDLTWAEEREYLQLVKRQKFWFIYCWPCCKDKEQSAADSAEGTGANTTPAWAKGADDKTRPVELTNMKSDGTIPEDKKPKKGRTSQTDDDLRLCFEKPGPCGCTPFCLQINCAPDRDGASYCCLISPFPHHSLLSLSLFHCVGDGELSCMERMDCDPDPGCFLYTMSCCCFFQCCFSCGISPQNKEKCKRLGCLIWCAQIPFREMCPINNRVKLDKCICFRGYFRAITLELGSILFGSFLVALVQWLRIMARVVEQELKRVTKGKKSKLIETISKVVHVLLAGACVQ